MVKGGGRVLGVAQGAELAAFEYDACRLLRGCAERGHPQAWLPEIMNADQGSQCHRLVWITTLTEAGVRISMGAR